MRCDFTSRGQELGSVFSADVGKVQASKCYIESLPLVLKDKRSCFSQGERFAVQLPLDRALALRNWHLKQSIDRSLCSTSAGGPLQCWGGDHL